MRGEVLDPRVDAEPADWAAFQAEHRLHAVWDYGLLRLESWLTRNPPVLVLVRDGGAIVGAASVMVCKPWWQPKFAGRPGRGVAPRWVEAYHPWLSGYPAFVLTGDPSEHRRIVAESERALARHLGVGLLGIVYRAVDAHALPSVAGRGRVSRESDPTTYLPTEWSSEDGWLGGLGAERRKSIRRYARKIDADPALVVTDENARTDLDTAGVAHLIHCHHVRLGRPSWDRRTKVGAAYLTEFLRRPDVRTLTYHDGDGRLLALRTLVENQDSTVLQHWAALPRELGGRPNLYFDAYLRSVRRVTETGAAELTSGRGLVDVKRSLGFRTRSMHTVLVPRPLVGAM